MKKYKAEVDDQSKKKFDKHKIRCHNCNILGHFKSECQKLVMEKAYVAAKAIDDGPHLLITEACKLTEEEPANPQPGVTERMTLVEEKVHTSRETLIGVYN